MRDKQELWDFLNSLINLETSRALGLRKKAYHLSFMSFFLDLLNHPEKQWDLIHVAGTNGKGSLCWILSHMLVSCGFNIGLYTSPHILNINERISFNNCPIDDIELIRVANQFKSLLENIPIKPHFFDAMTCLAILFFMEKTCDYIILEVGLGGRLDSTNFSHYYKSKIAIINAIDLDHTQQLGNSLEQIAQEKMGIVQKGNTLILGKQKHSLYPLLLKLGNQKKAKTFKYHTDFFAKDIQIYQDGISFIFSSIFLTKPITIQLPLLSPEQSINMSIALFVLQLLKIPFQKTQIHQTFQNDILQGRFQKYKDIPTVILDGAHNPHAIECLKSNLQKRYQNMREKILIIGISYGKDYPAMLKSIVSFFDVVIVCKLTVLIKTDISKDIFFDLTQEEYCTHVLYANSFQEAYKNALKHLPLNPLYSLIVVTGSFYLIGQALDYLNLNHSKT